MKIMPKVLLGFGIIALVNIMVGAFIYASVSTLRANIKGGNEALVAKESVLDFALLENETNNLLLDFMNSGDINVAKKIEENLTASEEIYAKAVETLKVMPASFTESLSTLKEKSDFWEEKFA